MMKQILDTVTGDKLKQAVNKAKMIDERNRLCSILSYDSGKTVDEIAAILYLNTDTVYSYIRSYKLNNKTKNDPRGGSATNLTPSQAKELKDYLSESGYLYVKDIIKYVLQHYQVNYTLSGITKWLKRQGFCYKKPATIPGKLSAQKQEEFIEQYKALRDSLPPDEEITFIDVVHPPQQSQCFGGMDIKEKKNICQQQPNSHAYTTWEHFHCRREKKPIRSFTINQQPLIKKLL